MAKLVDLRKRMQTIQNIETITRTLATVSAAKLSRTRQQAAGFREYTQKMREILHEQQEYLAKTDLSLISLSPLLREKRNLDRIAVFLISADRGMCGNYNLAACRLCLNFWNSREKNGQEVVFITKGIKGQKYLKKYGADIIHKESWRREGVLPKDVERILSYLINLYITGEVDEIYAVYTQFYSPIQQKPKLTRLLPIKIPADEKPKDAKVEKWSYEPAPKAIIRELLAIYLRVQLYEQGARMMTMEEATERAEKTLRECRMMYNRLRRELITNDLIGVLFASSVIEETAEAHERLA